MNASGNWVVTDKTNTSGNGSEFPALLMKGPCETGVMDVANYAFYTYAESVKQYEEIFKQLNSSKWAREHGYQFVMCRAEVDESGQVKVLGMVQFEKEPFLIDEIVQYKNALKRLLGASSGIPFFREIHDCNVNCVYRWLKYKGTGQIFKLGAFVFNWAVEGHVWTSEDEENDQDDMYMEHHLYF